MEERTQVNGSLALEQRRLIVIEPTSRPEAAKLRVAACARAAGLQAAGVHTRLAVS